MRYKKYILGLLSLMMTNNTTFGSHNESEEELKKNVLQKVNDNAKASDFSDEEKIQLYELDLLRKFSSSVQDYEGSSGTKNALKIDNLSSLANELRSFYSYKGNSDLEKIYAQKAAEWDLKAAFYGSYEHFTYIYSLYEKGFLEKKKFEFIKNNRVEEDGNIRDVSNLYKIISSREFQKVQKAFYKATEKSYKENHKGKRKRYTPYTDNEIIQCIIDENRYPTKKLKLDPIKKDESQY